MLNKILTIILLTISVSLFAQHSFNSYLPDNAGYREHSLDILSMKVVINFEPTEGKVFGKVSHTFKSLQSKTDSVFFNAPGITIKSVTCNGETISFSTNKEGVWFKSTTHFNYPTQGVLSINYEAKPARGIYFIGWNEPEHNEKSPWAVRKQIWTQGQGIDNRHWIPMYDDMNDKFVTETIITFDEKYNVLSNGVLRSKTNNKNNTNTWHYAMSKPHAGYLLMLAIGNYAVENTKSNTGVPLQHWYYPEFKERMEPTYRYTPQMFSFMEEQTGVKYPWETYSQVMVQDFLYGAMENTTATIFGDFFNVDERAFLDKNYISVNMHEFTHQWFGDFVTARDRRDTWLQESFATFYPKQFSKVLDGFDEWSWQRRQHQNAALEAGKKDNFAVRHTSGGTPRVYPKGAAVLSMLEYVLGEDQFKRVIKHYLDKHAYSNVETNDLQQAIKDELGLNLDWFFDQWIYRGGEPHYRIHYEDLFYGDSTRATEIAIEQIHATDETVRWFNMPINFEVHYTDGTLDKLTDIINGQFEVVKVKNPNKKTIAYVLFDPNCNILKQVTFNKSFQELAAQATNAKYMLDRYDAVVALRSTEIETKRNLLIKLLAEPNNQYAGLLNEIANQLFNDKTAESKAALTVLVTNNKAAVRENLFSKVAATDEFWKTSFINALADSSYDVVKTCLVKLCDAYPTEINTWLTKTDKVYGMNNAVRIKWLEIALNTDVNNQNYKNELEKYTSSMYEFRTRVNAFNTLKTLNYFNQKVCLNLFNAMLAKNGRLSGPASDLLTYFSVQAHYKSTAKTALLMFKGTKEQKETLLKMAPFLN